MTHPEWRFPNKATPVGSSAYYSVRFSAATLRDPLALLFAWRGEMRAVAERCSDPGVARLKLQWWRDELGRAAGGTSRHPLLRSLAPILQRHDLSLGALAAISNGAEIVVSGATVASLDDMETWLSADLGSLYRVIGELHGIRDPKDLDDLDRLGRFAGLVYLIRDLGGLCRRGQNPLPTGPTSADSAARPDVASLVGHAQALLRERPPLRRIPPPLAVHSAILQALLKELEAEGTAVFERRTGLPPLRKLWIGWRTSRRLRNGAGPP
jgi:phytoene synthase